MSYTGNPFEEDYLAETQSNGYEDYIKESAGLVSDAIDIISEYQTGKLKPIKFRKDFINDSLLGGLFPGTVLGIAGMSGHGKTYLTEELENDIFNPELNPDCENYMILKNNYEMSVFKLYLRNLKQALNKNIADILGSKFTPEEQVIADAVKNKASNPRIKYFQDPTDPATWLRVVEAFILKHMHVKHIVISIDHIALIKQTMAGKKDAIDNLIENINYLKNKYKNVSFILLSQLNRNIEERDNPKNSAPKKGDLYQSDFLYQLSDVIIVVHNPYKIGLQEHMVVGVDSYPHLNHIKKPTKAKYTQFYTKGLIFYHFIKLREDEFGSLSDVYVEKLYKPEFPMDYNPADLKQKELPKMQPSPEIFERLEDDDGEDYPF